jgi:UDP-N-acetylmuramoyl-tripeptide--D-alanyl-D-alanine ligase
MPAKTFALEELAAFCGAWIEKPAADGVQGLSFDSRKVRPGNLFVAVPGRPEPFFHDLLNDGHAYCADAARAGAAAVLVEREAAVPNGTGVLLSENVFEALRSIGLGARRAFGGQVVAVVGSCGKTTTKDFLAEVLSRRFRVSATEGNRNNILGVPETLANADDGAGAWVVEMGISSPGEMDILAAGVEPTGIVFTTIQPVHMEYFSSLEAIRDEKIRALAFLRPGGFAVLNADDPLIADAPVPSWVRRITYGQADSADLRFEVEGTAGPGGVPFRFHHGGRTADGLLPVPGVHQLANFAAAVATGLTLGMDLDAAVGAAGSLKAASHRGQILTLRGGTLLMDDSYNANPAAVELALRTVCGWGPQAVVALGEMRELGTRAREDHLRVGRLAADLGVQALLCVGGEAARALGESFAGSGRPFRAVSRWEDGRDWFLGQIREGDAVLVKGSRAWGLDRLAAWISEEMAP